MTGSHERSTRITPASKSTWSTGVHGCLEHGSPVLPATRESLLVHTMEKLSGDLGSFDRLERETGVDERWSRYDRTLGRSVLLTSPYPDVRTNLGDENPAPALAV
ncbi:MAG: hypothetical protein M3Z66_17010 [Chloroflexota bacterium]|nr:hypothetical protein [Chloroflexota bacterium]